MNKIQGADWNNGSHDMPDQIIINLGKEAQLSHSDAEHYLPLLYTSGIEKENLTRWSFFNDKAVGVHSP